MFDSAQKCIVILSEIKKLSNKVLNTYKSIYMPILEDFFEGLLVF